MKKTYIMPEQFAVELQASQIMALSTQGGTSADPSKPVLTKEVNDLDFWDEDDNSSALRNPKYFD